MNLQEKKINYKEKIVKLGRQLNEKKLKESSFSSLVEPVVQLLSGLDTVSTDVTAIPYNEIISTDSNLELDVSEQELDTKGTLTETVKKKRALQEAVGASAAIREYIQQGGEKDYNAFVEFCNTNGYEDIPNNYKRGLFNYKYEELYTKVIAQGNRINAQQAFTKEPPEVSKNLESFITLANAGTEFMETAVDTVNAKYKSINIKLQKVILGKSLKNYYLLMGDAGIGKSYIVREALNKVGKGDTPMVTGSVGTSQSAVALFLWQNRNKELVVLDDCDSMIKANVSVDVANMLKGAMDPDKHHVHISPTIRKNASYLLDQMGVGEDEDIDGVIENTEELEDDESGLSIPSDWDFNARVIFISNLNESDVNAAVLSRCDYYELHLTQEEYMVRLGMVIKGIDCGQGKIYDEQEVMDAKALLTMTLAAIIEAGNKGVKLYNRPVRLRNGGLEFRLVKDMVEGFLSLVDYEANDNPNESRDEIKKRCVPEWVRTIVIPRITA